MELKQFCPHNCRDDLCLVFCTYPSSIWICIHFRDDIWLIIFYWQVDVKGSLTDQKKRSDVYVKNSVNKIRPFAAQRILKMARYVLKTPTVQRS